MSIRHLWAVTRKEIQHILRDRATLILVLFTPLALLLLMAYALTVDLKDIPIAVLDYEKSPTSTVFVEKLTAGEDLLLFAHARNMDEIESMLVKGQVKAALVIGPNFSADLLSLSGLDLQVIIDGTEPESGEFAVDHIGWRAEEAIDELLSVQMQAMGINLQTLQPLDLRVRSWYNPSLKPQVDLIPGLLSMVMGLPALSVALTLAREREHGTLEQLMATPIRRIELLLGKMLPYVFVGMLNVVLCQPLPFSGLTFPLMEIFSCFLGFRCCLCLPSYPWV